MATIPLAKGFKESALVYPVLLSEKIDGVPVCVTLRVDSAGIPAEYTIRSRQDKPVPSVVTIVDEWLVANKLTFDGFPGLHKIVGEVHQTKDARAPFKDTGGIVRRQEDQGHALSMAIFDYNWDGCDHSYYDRMVSLQDRQVNTDNVYIVASYHIDDAEDLRLISENWMAKHPDAEGMIARSADDTFKPGKRSWGYQKILNEPTIDLWVIGVQEAVAGDGTRKGMAGGLVVKYGNGVTKVGPGKMAHTLRSQLFLMSKYTGHTMLGLPGEPNTLWYTTPRIRMAEIKHKADSSYDMLRQPTFQHWRDDKDEPDA